MQANVTLLGLRVIFLNLKRNGSTTDMVSMGADHTFSHSSSEVSSLD
jgi:hypothetical protein